MQENKKHNVEEIVEEYRKNLEKLFQGEKAESFDTITTDVIGKIKTKLQQVAEETADAISKKNRKTPMSNMRTRIKNKSI